MTMTVNGTVSEILAWTDDWLILY